MAEIDDSVIVIDSSNSSSATEGSDVVVEVLDDDEPQQQQQQQSTKKLEKDVMECPICLQTCIHPARLPCGHIFCFLCVKGVAYKNSRCAMCRREIPPEFLDHPQLVHGIQDLCKTKSTDDGYQWFYEGRNGGWWEYDDRTTNELEEAFTDEMSDVDLLICGTLYTIDFKRMIQFPKNSESRKRKIKREKSGTVATKGVAGWWQYDERTSQDIEEAYKKGKKTCKILVAGNVYVVDFELMLQQRQNDPSRRRHVKRDLASIPKKGVAGLRIEGNTVTTDSSESHYHHNISNNSSSSSSSSSSNTSSSISGNSNESQRQNSSSNFISTIAATDAAIRIASDIIDSTLAHADDRDGGNSSGLGIAGSGSNNSGNGSSDDVNDINGEGNNSSRSREFLQEAEHLLDVTQSANLIPFEQSNLFSQTLDDFRSLTLQNVIDSSDSEDDRDPIIL